jgi:ferrous iron transport protein A
MPIFGDVSLRETVLVFYLKLSLISLMFDLTMTAKPLNLLMPLCQLPPRATGRISKLKGDSEFCQRVREMGFGESTFVTKVSGNRTILCQVNGTRIALSHDAASQILVERVGAR